MSVNKEKYIEIINELGKNVDLVAVSKLKSVEDILQLYEMGQRDFAENYVQEALQKKNSLSDLNLQWHFIGSLQKNKVKNVVGEFSLIHSVDSLELLQKINSVAAAKGLIQDVLLQVNLVHEESKSGMDISELQQLKSRLFALPHARIRGFMCMPPMSRLNSENGPSV